MRELLYLSTEKLRDFSETSASRFSVRAVEVEASVLGAIRARVSAEADSVGEGLPEDRLEKVIAHLQETYRAHSRDPGSCESLMTRNWMEFTGPFLYGPRVRDLGLIDRGVYTFMSLDEDPSCPLRHGEEQCPGVEIILCGSRQHVRTEHNCEPTRMGSGSDWLHDLAADLVDREERGDTSFPGRLFSTNRRDQEFAARSAYSMLASYCEGPAYLHGHARVLCNFAPSRFEHRLIVATPLYVEVEQRPEPAATTVATDSSLTHTGWRRLFRFGR